MIEIKNLTKIYKLNKKQMALNRTKENTKTAVKDINIKAKEGEIFGLLGPNGAGKTTTLRCIATLLKPTEGSITLSGYDTIKEAEQVRKRLGFLTNEIKLDPQFTPNYLFNFFGKLHGIEKNILEERKESLFNYFGIHDFEDKKINELSTGMKQKAAIAISLVHDPEVIIFDEPTTGLDIITAHSVIQYLKLLKQQGKLVIISTHIMAEAEKLCDQIAIILDGQKIIEGSVDYILQTTQSSDLEEAFFSLYQKRKETK